MAADGQLRVKFPSPLPPGSITGLANPTCYMRETRNCSEDVSAAPYMSKSVVDAFAAATNCATLRPYTEGGEAAVSIDDFPSDILCARHKSAVSSLDAVAAQALNNLAAASNYVMTKSLATKRALYAVSGEGLELWALKLLFGAYHGMMLAEDAEALKGIQPLDFGIFQMALEGGALAISCGFYFRRAMGEASWGPLMSEARDRFIGVRFRIGALECELIADSTDLNLDMVRWRNSYRPSGIDLVGRKRSAHVNFSGPAFAVNGSMRLELSGARVHERVALSGTKRSN